jgi:hypothetical protein
MFPGLGGPYPNLYTSLVDVVPRVTDADVGCRALRIPPSYGDGSFVGFDSAQHFVQSVGAVFIGILTYRPDYDGNVEMELRPASEYWICAKHLVGRKPDLSTSFTSKQKVEYIHHFARHNFASVRALADKLQGELYMSGEPEVKKAPATVYFHSWNATSDKRIDVGTDNKGPDTNAPPPIPISKKPESADKPCVVCQDTPKNTAFQPCGHYVCCASCALEMKLCPICRRNISSRLKIFES